jgi:secondary thiamine-phosphate synthase enzyme
MIELSVQTSSRIQAINISDRVAEAARGKAGNLLHVYTPHTTCGLLINEAADPDVINDIIVSLNKIAPADYPYKHMEGNSDAHIKSVLTGSSVFVPLAQGALQLGTWQGIFFMEFDGPRKRKVIVTVL